MNVACLHLLYETLVDKHQLSYFERHSKNLGIKGVYVSLHYLLVRLFCPLFNAYCVKDILLDVFRDNDSRDLLNTNCVL